jgi:hypothetical protein
MPPQQHERLLDLIDDVLDFRAHDFSFVALRPHSICIVSNQYEMMGTIRQEP